MPPRRRRVAAALAVAALLLGAGLAAARLWRSRFAPHREAGLDVLLITVDTLRADALGAYGRAEAETPWIDRLAASGVRFETARAHNVVTLPSHATILSGLTPLGHGIRDNAGFRFPPDAPSLAALLRERGYATAAFVSGFPLDSRFGLDRGFEVYDDQYANADTQAAFAIEERAAGDTLARARAWIAARGERPWFCWIHLYDPHFPYAPPEPWRQRFAREPYHGEVAAVDAALGPLLEPLLAAGASGRTLVALTSDHGESLGEHGEMTHGIFAYEATLRVPLVVFAPRLFAPRVVSEAVGLADLAPTLLDAVALPVAPAMSGRSLLPALAGRRLGPAPHYFEALSAALNRGWAPLTGVVRDARKYVELPLPELYDLASDASEARNLAASEPAGLESLRGLLAGLRRDDPGWARGEESAEVRERLAALGYVTAGGGAAKASYTDADDPKRLIELDARLQLVVELYRRGELDEALALAESVVSQRPDMAVALSHLALLQRAVGDLPAAIATLERALAHDPDAETAALLASYLNEAGRFDAALALLEPYRRAEPPDLDVLIATGVAHAERGEPGLALAAFERARSLDPTNPLPLVNAATVQLGAGDLERARTGFEAALALNPAVARAENALGVIAAREGRSDAAVAHWKRAVLLDPESWDTLFNLGGVLLDAGRVAEARPYLERFARGAPPALYARDLARVRGWLARTGS